MRVGRLMLKAGGCVAVCWRLTRARRRLAVHSRLVQCMACVCELLCLRVALPCPRAALLPAHCPAGSRTALPCPRAAMPCVGRFDTWLDNLQLYLLSDSRDRILLFDHTSRASLAPPATPDSATRSQWLTHDAAARLAVRNRLPLAEHAHFGQRKTAKALYNTVVARYSSPATAALGPLPDSRAFLDRNPPPMYITLYFIVTRLPDSLRAVRGHFLALDPTDLTVDLLEKHLLAAETSVVAIGASRGTPRTPFFEGCSPSPLAPSYASAAAVDILGAEDVRAASALSGKHRSSKGKGGTSGGGGSGGGGGGGSGGGGGGGGGGSGGSGGGSGGFVGSSGGSGGGGGGGGSGSGGGGSGGERGGAVQQGGSGGGQRQQQQQHQSETPTPQQLRDRAGQTCRKFHTQHRCFSHLDDAWRSDFGDEAECPRWLELLRYGVDIFALEYDAILAAMYALSASAEGDCYLCVSPDPGIEVAALSASDSALSGTGTAEALHTFTLDSGASRCFFRDSTTLTPLPAPVSVRMSDPSGGPVLAHSSTVLSCPAVPSGSLSCLELPSFSTNLVSTAALHDAMVTTTTPGGQPVSIYTCTRTSHHLATFTCRPGSSLYTMTAEPPQDRERYFLLVVDDYTRYTTVFPLRSKDRGGEFSSDLLRDFCHGEGILQSFTLPASPQQNGVPERRIGLVMEVARTSMIHAAAPHFL
ncbi:unnamed protein product [Closterium sp. NIES-53]